MKKVRQVLCALLALPAIAHAAAIQYELVDIGALSNGFSGLSINDRGQVAGTTPAADGTPRIFIWQDGVRTLLGDPSRAAAAGELNNSGFVAGTDFSADGGLRRYSPDGVEPVAAGRVAGASLGPGINDRGDVVGTICQPSVASSCGVLFRDGQLSDLGSGGFYSVGVAAYDINNRGQVAGAGSFREQRGAPAVNSAFIWENGNYRLIEGGEGRTAFRINDAGSLVGRRLVNQVSNLPTAWIGGAWIDLPVIAGFEGIAFGLNERNEIVGFEGLGDMSRAILWRDGLRLDLNEVVSLPTGLVVNAATSINKDGWIAAVASDGDQIRGVVLRPIPEPPGLLFAAVATALLLRRFAHGR
jgi:hypothetical protein